MSGRGRGKSHNSRDLDRAQDFLTLSLLARHKGDLGQGWLPGVVTSCSVESRAWSSLPGAVLGV